MLRTPDSRFADLPGWPHPPQHAHPLGTAAARIGDVTDDPRHFVQMQTHFGGRRVVDWLSGEQLPRIC